jgi:transcriptional regulator with XRE-family HTH domain
VRKLRRIRAEKGLTMDTLEERTGVSKRTISEIERGMRTPHTLTLAKLANALEVDLDELLEEEAGKGDAPPSSPEPEKVSEEERRARLGGLGEAVESLAEWAEGLARDPELFNKQRVIDVVFAGGKVAGLRDAANWLGATARDALEGAEEEEAQRLSTALHRLTDATDRLCKRVTDEGPGEELAAELQERPLEPGKHGVNG